MNMRFLLAFFLTTLVLTSAPAQQGNQPQPSFSLPRSEPRSNDTGAVSAAEIAVLKAQLAMAEKHNEQVLSTVQWTIGLCVSLFTVLFGVGWFSNFRIYQRDKSTFEASIDKSLAKATLELQLNVSAQMTQATSQLKSIAGHQMASIHASVKALEKRVAQNKTEAEFYFGNIDAEKWVTKGVGSNALRVLFMNLERAVELKEDYFIEVVLDEIVQLVDGKHKRVIFWTLDAGDTALIARVLDMVPQAYEQQKKHIQEGIAKFPPRLI